MTNTVEKGKRSIASIFWGRTAELNIWYRVAALVFVIVAIAAMSFCQLGFWSIGMIDGKPVYLMLLLAPIALGGLAFGPITGALLGLYAGAVVYAHAVFLPLDYYEVYYMSPLNSFGLLTIVGAASGLLFSLALRKARSVGQGVVFIGVVCLVVSFFATGFSLISVIIMYGGLEYLDIIVEFLLMSPIGIVVQALLDALTMMIVCWVGYRILFVTQHRGETRMLLAVFCNWMILVSAIVFMTTSAFVFAFTTVQAQGEAEADMISEIQYLKKQLTLVQSEDYTEMLDGYTPSLDGYVVITDKNGIILASDDEDRYARGASLPKELGYDYEAEADSAESAPPAAEESATEELAGEAPASEGSANEESASEGADIFADVFFASLINEKEVAVLQAVDEDGEITMDFLYAAAGAFDGGYTVMMRTPDMVYANRFETMAALTLLAIVLIAGIAILAVILLNNVVVRRIDETNISLDKITKGNLNERVNARDSREFASLSRGINTTVSALKDTIEEVKQHNAQDLATAKTIQESALPREFPPFPQIDKFDIYASMKTAKEVGGDFYDFFLIGDENDKLGFVMADVSGKGIPAALFMMSAKTQIQNYMEAGLPIGEAINAANHQLCIGNDAGMFVTMFACILDYETGELSYVNAGHNPPIILHEGKWEWMRDVSGMPLGLFDGIPYDAFTRQLEVGDMLYLYTDGVTEAMDAQGNLFGEDRLLETLYEYSDMNPRSVGVGVRRAITDFTLDAEQSDDITMLALKYGVPPERKAVMVLKADDKQLVHVYNFIHEELHRRNAPRSVRNPLDIAAEELFVNVCHYAYPDATPENPGEVRISFEYEANPPSLTVQIADDGIPYNPLAKPDAVTPENIEDVPIGGLGILMAKKSVDEMSYERVGESNVLTIVKGW